ncbi:SDH family Clp fold serine proteinase [Thermosulfurimonas dismutans]|uniref:Periplasmic serine protease n=1 Tax=Thermosulfurimonas dismutans TaxID=999894 RepID=A0A179D3F0_9BACT|nr:ATP-dependent Clp protease proteolytic subunit [Thermosulfurimonas dismutans]OAQ20587.1 hypothetical protein TDIS_1356 [Thermosulfurimonas dismutans]
MSGFDVLWFFFILMALQPVLRQRLLEAARQRMIAKIEKMRGSRVILLVHRQETMSLLGFPIMRFIDINDSEQVIRAIHMTDPDVPIDIILHTPGGLVLAALQIARAVKKHPAKVTAFVPHYAMSGGTLIALAADEIVMDEHAVLGPVDPQLGQFPAASILRVAREKPLEHVDDQTLIMADMAEKALRQMKENLRDLLSDRYPPEKAEELAEVLSQGHWTHDYPITFEEAKKLGLPVKTDLPHEIYQLMSLFPQPVRQIPSVEYTPVPRKAPAGSQNHKSTFSLLRTLFH